MGDPKKVNADLEMTAFVACPRYGCGSFDLFEIDSLTEEGEIYKAAIQDDGVLGLKGWNKEIQCPTCKTTLIVEDIEW